MTPTQLANWRQRIGLTQKQAAKALGVPLSSYCQWEQGRIDPHALLKWATVGYESKHRRLAHIAALAQQERIP